MSHMHVWMSREMLLDEHLPEECPERLNVRTFSDDGDVYIHGECELQTVPIRYKFCRCGRTLL